MALSDDTSPTQEDQESEPTTQGDNPESDFLEEEPVSSDEESTDASRIFRRVSLERLSVPDQLDRLFVPYNSPVLLIWTSLGAMVVTALLWLFFGSLPVLIEGAGIVMSREGIFTIQSKTKGIVEELNAVAGASIKKDQLVAKIEDPQEKLRYEASLQKVHALEENLAQLEKQVQSERVTEKKALEEQISATEYTIQQLEKAIPSLTNESQAQENLLNQGLISSKEFYVIKEVLSQNLVALETAKGNLATLNANLAKSYREQEIQEKKRSFLEALQQSDLLKSSLNYNNIYSPSDGKVLEILVTKGSRVQSGNPLIQMEYQVEGNVSHIFYAYVPIEVGKGVQLGTRVSIELSTVKAEEYGAIIGHITAVSSYAVSRESIANIIQNEGLVNFLIKGASTAIQLTIEPVLDPSTPTGYKWTSGNGPSILITTGTVCIVRGIVDRLQPVFYFFPLWKLEKLTKILSHNPYFFKKEVIYD